jgi:type IV pilus assembly protein PilC
MLSYKYTARDTASGEKISSTVEAESEQAAAKLIKGQGLSPIDIVLANTNKGVGKFRNHVKARDRILFARQLSTLINAGLPLVQSLRTVGKQTQSKPLKIILNKIISDVEAGSAFNVALAKHPETFNQIFIS